MEMKKFIVYHPGRCTGCKICEMVCSFTNEQEFNSQRARIRNVGLLNEALFISFTCMQCADPPCVSVCPSAALVREDGIVRIDSQRCFGCKLCILLCPLGAIHFDDQNGLAFKCELCGGDPQCVAYCPTGAVQYEEVESANIDKQENLLWHIKEVYMSSKSEG